MLKVNLIRVQLAPLAVVRPTVARTMPCYVLESVRNAMVFQDLVTSLINVKLTMWLSIKKIRLFN